MTSAGRETSRIGRKLDTDPAWVIAGDPDTHPGWVVAGDPDSHPDRVVAQLAEKQHGVVSLAQLERAGLSANAVHKRSATGRLHRVHRGVYAIGHAPLTHRARCVAAVLACGPGAALSHTTAADVLTIAPSASPTIHITVPTNAGRSPRGLRVHRSRTLVFADHTTVDGIAVTNVARTLLDLTDVFSVERLARAIEAADRLRLFDGVALERTLAHAGGPPAAHRLRAALTAYTGEPSPVRSELERRALGSSRTRACPGQGQHAGRHRRRAAGGGLLLARPSAGGRGGLVRVPWNPSRLRA